MGRGKKRVEKCIHLEKKTKFLFPHISIPASFPKEASKKRNSSFFRPLFSRRFDVVVFAWSIHQSTLYSGNQFMRAFPILPERESDRAKATKIDLNATKDNNKNNNFPSNHQQIWSSSPTILPPLTSSSEYYQQQLK